MEVAVEHRVIAKNNQQFGAGQKFPTVASRKLRVLTDVVVFDLGQKLHVRCEIQSKIERADVDCHVPGRQVDVLPSMVSDDRDQLVGTSVMVVSVWSICPL